MPEELEFIIKLIFLIIGIAGLIYSTHSVLMSQAASSWRSIPGTIEYHGIEETISDGDRIYEAKVEYSYQFRGKKYMGKRIGFGYHSWNIKWFANAAYKDVTRMTPSVRVYVNPRNPNLSTLLKGIRSFHVANILFFTFWSAFVYEILTNESI